MLNENDRIAMNCFRSSQFRHRIWIRPVIYITLVAILCLLTFYNYIGSKSELNWRMKMIFDANTKYKHSIIESNSEIQTEEHETIEFANYSNNISGFPNPIVPDIVHLIYFRTRQITFEQMICIRSIVRHHNPARILIHCNYCVNRTMEGKYWDMLGHEYRRVIQVVDMEEPTEIFGRNLTSVHHASDVARIRVLMKYGGIFLDNDMYVVKGLHGFRHYEMVVAWEDRGVLGNQVLIAHKDARFLKLYLDSYHNYQGGKWYFNGGEYPTTSIINKRPELVHIVKYLFGADYIVSPKLYRMNWPDWTTHYTFHLLSRFPHLWGPREGLKEFNEINMKTYNTTFGQMARLVLYGKPDLINN